MKKNLFAILMAAAMILSLLAGCGGQTTASQPEPAPAPVSSVEERAEEPAPAPVEEEPAAPEEPASVPAEEEAPVVEHQYSFPNSENALLDYSNEYSLPLCEETETITWMRNAINLMGPLGNLGIETFQDMEYIQHLQEITNISIEFTELDFFTSAEKMNIAIASGDYAAIISDLQYTGGATGALADSVIVDLTDLLPDYAPNYNYMINSNPDYASIFRNDGMVLCFQSPYENFINNQGMVIRKDWLEEQNLAVPTTYDEMYEVLTVFKDVYGASTPIYMNSDCVINGLCTGFDVASMSAGGMATSLPYFVKDGQVHCSLIEDGYKAYLQEMNKWYNAGLFDKDFISIQFDPFSSYLDGQITTDQMGVWCTSGEGIDNYTVPIACVPYLTANEDGMDHVTSTSLITDSSNTYITSCCDNVELAMRLVDYFYSEDGILFYNYGFEGVDYTIDENGTPQFTEAVTNNEFGLSPANYMRVRCGYGVFSSLMLRYRSAAYNSDINNEAWDVWSSNLDGSMCIPSNVSMTPEETETSAYYVTDIMTYACQMIPQFINGSVGFDQWDSYVENLKGMNIEACIAAEQSAYDRCME